MTNNAKMAEAISAILVLESFRTDAEQVLLRKGHDDITSEWIARQISSLFKTSKERKSALHWYMSGGISKMTLANSPDEVRTAVELANRYGIDPMSVRGPDDILKQTEKRVQDDHIISLDEIENNPLISNFEEVEAEDGNTWHECEIEDSREGMMFVRRIVDTHWGRKRNPWCLISRENDGGMDEAWAYWRKYCGSHKWMAFCNGRIVAFAASNPFSDDFDDYIPYPDSAYIYIATQTSSKDVFARFYDEWKESGSDEEFKEWLYQNHEDVWDKIGEILDGRGWIPPYDELDIEHKYEYEDNMEWWDMDDEPQSNMFDCV